MLLQNDNSIIYGLDHQARSLCSVATEQEQAQFLVGTQTLKFENQICLIEVDDDANQVLNTVYKHDHGEIWHLAASLCNSDVVASCYSKVIGSRAVSGCSVFRMTSGDTSDQNCLQELCSFPKEETQSLTYFEWQPNTEKCDRAAVLCDQKIAIVNVDSDDSKMKIECESEQMCKGSASNMTLKWNPHHNSNLVAVSVDSAVKSLDIRTMKDAFTMDSCHFGAVRDMHFNPNRQYYIATAGDDSKVKIWDYRNSCKPVHIIPAHSHWVWCVRFNPIHDQLILSCSSDAKVVLYCGASFSSETGEDTVDESEDNNVISDGVIRTYEEHEESVYCCDWSIADPWIFASLSYDGRLIINHVPNNTKYQILQL